MSFRLNVVKITAFDPRIDRSMQYTKIFVSRRIIRDGVKTENLLYGSPKACDVGALEEGRFKSVNCSIFRFDTTRRYSEFLSSMAVSGLCRGAITIGNVSCQAGRASWSMAADHSIHCSPDCSDEPVIPLPGNQ